MPQDPGMLAWIKTITCPERRLHSIDRNALGLGKLETEHQLLSLWSCGISIFLLGAFIAVLIRKMCDEIAINGRDREFYLCISVSFHPRHMGNEKGVVGFPK